VDPAQRLEELLSVREPLYREIADLTVSTDQRRVPSVSDFIAQKFRESLQPDLATAAAVDACRP
jgi:shikimate kinase